MTDPKPIDAFETIKVDDDAKAGFARWLAGRPANVRAVAEKLLPWIKYRIKSTGQPCMIQSYGEHEDGSVTLTVNTTDRFGIVRYDVFGLEPDDIEVFPDTPGP
jgi:hypothetical protein